MEKGKILKQTVLQYAIPNKKKQNKFYYLLYPIIHKKLFLSYVSKQVKLK